MTIRATPRILLAPDSFKGCLIAMEVCLAIEKGLKKTLPEATCDVCPLGDGGEGTLDVLLAQWPGGQLKPVRVTGPFPSQKVDAVYGWWPESGIAVVEAAKACGLPLVQEGPLRPLATTTFGVGELIGTAIDSGARTIILTVGGSATMDGGLGAARALGWRALDSKGRDLDHGGGALIHLSKLCPPDDSWPCPMVVWHDVANPLTGPSGAAAVFGPQKGATPEQITTIEKGLCKLSSFFREMTDDAIDNLPGGGAAGGLAAGMHAFFGAKLAPGSGQIAAAVNLAERVSACDWIITGEGCFDATSTQGKVVGTVAELVRKAGKPLALIAGSLKADAELIQAKIAVDIRTNAGSLQAAITHATRYLEEAGGTVGNTICHMNASQT